MSNTLPGRYQRNSRTADTVEVDANTMSNSMTMLLIYHGLPPVIGKNHPTGNNPHGNKPTR
ncbi:hypothetical protein [Providencia sp.]|uniref:hypothetical protein n=1 Tax=Providencia TaxID=586 RepID=UPI0024AC34C9|nr:hypothetical protein [Providencia rettgeri]ELR5227026.1 hypothetical protein [Providencia rettgeri]HEM6922667.1 hypothetical protein [Providencia rettgeri]